MKLVLFLSCVLGLTPPASSRCPGDVTCNGFVDNADLAAWQGQASGNPCPGCSADLDGNGFVDAADLSIIAQNMGRCCTDLNNDGRGDALDVSILAQSMGNCGAGPCPADINCDGVVNNTDAAFFEANLPCTAAHAVPATKAWSVSVAIAVIAAAGLFALRRRRALSRIA